MNQESNRDQAATAGTAATADAPQSSFGNYLREHIAVARGSILYGLVVSIVLSPLLSLLQPEGWIVSVALAVLGGLDSILGAVIAGIILGILENVGADFLDPLVGGGSRELIVAAVLILTVMIRPHGLFGRHEIERV